MSGSEIHSCLQSINWITLVSYRYVKTPYSNDFFQLSRLWISLPDMLILYYIVCSSKKKGYCCIRMKNQNRFQLTFFWFRMLKGIQDIKKSFALGRDLNFVNFEFQKHLFYKFSILAREKKKNWNMYQPITLL